MPVQNRLWKTTITHIHLQQILTLTYQLCSKLIEIEG